MPDPEFYAECLQASFDELAEVTRPAPSEFAVATASPAPAKAPAKKAKKVVSPPGKKAAAGKQSAAAKRPASTA